MYKHILVAVDGSDTSNLALQEAIKLAKEQQAALRLVHVVDENPAYMMMGEPPAFMMPAYTPLYSVAEYQKVVREAGQNVLATCAATARQAGIEVDTKLAILEVLAKRICDSINEEAERWPADLIVIGTHGRHGFNHLLLGSVAEGVIRLATKPILMIRGTRS